MKRDTPCRKCNKLHNHFSGYCLEHRKEWREGYKAGVQLREEGLDIVYKDLVWELENTATHPIFKAMGYTPLFIRVANALRKSKKVK